MATEKGEANMFIVHGKSNLFLYKCVPLESQDAPSNMEDNGKSDVLNNLKIECIWSLDRFVRHYARSLDNSIAIVDDRVGLSIVHVKNNTGSDLLFDTLRGVGKFKSLYTSVGYKNIKYLQWSDNGIYLVVYFNLSNYSKEGGACLEDNLHIWDISQKSIVGTFSTRRLSPEQWPIIKWIGKTDNFVLCYGHQVALYSISCPEGTTLKTITLLLSIPIPRVFCVELFFDSNGLDSEDSSSQGNLSILGKGQSITLASFSKADVSSKVMGNLRISRIVSDNDEIVEDSFKEHELKLADSAELLWSPSGKYLMVLCQSTVDLAGEKYGSTTNCLLFTKQGDFERQVNSSITHDARWNPKEDEFILMQGNMPCEITLYDANCRPLFEFPKLYRNTAKWSPMGNMVALCGFGNLAGEICFWYRKPESGEMEQIVQFKEPCTVLSEWSLDSKYFMTASTFPRMKVDNFFKVFNCEGDLLESRKLEECYDVCWLFKKANEEDFVRPRVRKAAQRKAIYRPKIQPRADTSRDVSGDGQLSKSTKSPPLAPQHSSPLPKCSRVPKHQIFPACGVNHFVSDVRPEMVEIAANNSSRITSKVMNPADSSTGFLEHRDNKSLFSNDFGCKSDPSVDLLDAFQHVFSLSQIREAPRAPSPSFEGIATPHQISGTNPQGAYQAYMHGRDRASMMPPPPPSYPPVQASARMLEHKFLQDQRQFGHMEPKRFNSHFRQNHNQNQTNPAAQEAANKSLSMLMRIRNQLQCEKSKPLQQSILDEGRLLRLLLEAKNRSTNQNRID